MPPHSLLLLAAVLRPWLAASGATARRRARTVVRAGGLLVATGLAVVLGTGTASAATLVADGPAHGDVLDPVVLAPDGNRVFFLADLAQDHKVELWSASTGGGGARRVSPALAADSDVYGFALSPDGTRVVYLADQRTTNVLELFTMPSTGGPSVPLHGALPGDRDVRRFAMTADGSRVVFLADLQDDGVFGMYSVAAAGGPVVELTGDLPPGVDVDDDFLLTLDGTRAVLRADMGDGVHDLFTVPLDGSGQTEPLSADVLSERGVEPDLVANRDVSVVSFRMEVEPGVFHRWAVPTDGSADAQLVHPELPEGARGADEAAAVSHDGSSLVFVADHATPGRAGVWLAPTNGSAAPRELSGRMAGDGVVHEVQLTADDTTAVYLAEQRGEGLSELFAVSLDTVERERRVSATMVRGGDVAAGFEVLRDGSGVVYRADGRRNGQHELYLSSLEGRASARVLNMDLPGDGDVAAVDADEPAFQVSWDGSEVLFLADSEHDGDVELFTVGTADGQVPVQLNDHRDGRSVEDVTAMVAGRVGFVTVDSANQSDEDLFVAATQSPPAPLDPDVQFGPRGAVVSWEPPASAAPVDSYVITVTPGGTTVEVGGDVTSAEVDGLDPGVTYVFTVRSVNDAGVSPGVRTEPGQVPQPPAAVASIDVVAGRQSLTASWVPGRGGSTVDAFVVQVLPGGDPVQVPNTVRDLTVVGLDPAVGHTVEVTAVGPEGISPTAALGPVRPLQSDGRPAQGVPSLPPPVFDPGAVPATPDPATPDPATPGADPAVDDGRAAQAGVDRVSGRNRYATAAAVSQASHPDGVDSVLLATGTSFPDALAAGPVSGVSDCPILLVDPGVLPSETAAELVRLAPSEIVVLGGERAVAPAVVRATQELLGSGVTIRRVAGGDRYDTAARLSAMTFVPDVNEVWLATGTNFPDALAAGAVAGRRGVPILLTDPATLPPATRAELRRLQPGRVVVLGGTGAVAGAVVAQVSAAVGSGVDVDRVSGPDRYATAAAVAQVGFPSRADHVHLAVGTNFPDALAAGPLAAARGGPILLTDRDGLPPATRTGMAARSPLRITLLGGEAAVSAGVAGEVGTLLR